MKQIITEKEILVALERQTFLIEQRITKNGYSFEEACELIQGALLHLNDIHTFAPKFLSKQHLERFELTLQDVQNAPTDLFKRYVNPDDYNKSIILIKDVLLKHKRKAVGFVQRAAIDPVKGLEPLYTTSRIYNKQPCLAGITIPLAKVGKVTNKMVRALEETNYMKMNYHKFASLTPRELEIVPLLALGYQNTEIGEQLFISKATVEQHRKNLKRKLEIRRFVDLIRFAQAFDLI
ncbi:response regulator transcription factor [Microscilla marina]|uniref:Transcriptional regulator, LuxR family protein n=1 Tax=Microscilla marina ATCC 23134 TaxID=313606 RepID=A1ZG53_MICM2|nr:helix-turn-helix transcriptional regulator [Microscilla marina]EAY30470.1 transcriptional regulator, LuxR family protein [Microscilla marina ATCC 23134]